MKRFIYIIIGLALLLTSASAQIVFRTAELQRLATVLAIDPTILQEGYNYLDTDRQSLVVTKMNHTVNHIGLRLFNEDMRKMGDTPVMDFLERYFLQLKYPPKVTSAKNMIRDDQFQFVTGTLQTVGELKPTDLFSLNYDKRLYTASWTREGQPLLVVTFPVEYELISGENKIEAENLLQADILATDITNEPPKPASELGNPFEHFSGKLYKQRGALIYSERHPAETVANMMISQQIKGAFDLNLTQVSYGFKKTTFTVPLRQWISFCQNHGCQLYVGIEDVKENGDVSAVVLAVNEAENYNHVLTLSVPSDMIRARQGQIDARIYPYVPTHNVANLFAAYGKSNPKTFVSK